MLPWKFVRPRADHDLSARETLDDPAIESIGLVLQIPRVRVLRGQVRAPHGTQFGEFDELTGLDLGAQSHMLESGANRRVGFIQVKAGQHSRKRYGELRNELEFRFGPRT